MENRVIQTRVRLARNLEAYPFPPAMTLELSETVANFVMLWLHTTASPFDFRVFRLNDISLDQRLELFHRHLISSDFLDNTLSRGLALSKDESVSLMINEEDHLRIQALRSGYQLREALKDAIKVHHLLENQFALAFHPQFGYLTACTTNVGTGLRASVQLHLPGITLSKDADRMVQTLTNLGIELRGTYGERSEVYGDVYQVSNRKTLGNTEEQIIRELEKVVEMLLQAEDIARERYIVGNSLMKDKMYRALGVVHYARQLGYKEAYDLISLLRLASELGYEGFPDIVDLDAGLVFLKDQSELIVSNNEEKSAFERAEGIRAVLFKQPSL